MTRDALSGARVLLVALGVGVGLSFALVLLGANDAASFGDVLRGTVLVTGAAFGGHGSLRVGGAEVAITAAPLMASLLSMIAAWCLLRRRPLGLDWVGVVAVVAGLMMYGAVIFASGVHGWSVNAAASGGGVAGALLAVGALASATDRWPALRRGLDLVVVAAVGVVLIGVITEVVCGLSYSGSGTGRVPFHAEIALAIAYAPNAGAGALGLGLGGGLAVTGISPSYFTFVARLAGDGPTAEFGAPHGEGDWAQALHLPGLVSVLVLAPILVLLLAYSARWLRSRGELITWAIGLGVLLVGLSFLAVARISVNYDGFVLGAALDPTWWARLAGLTAIPLGWAVFMVTGSAGEPRLDVGDGARQFSREVP